MLESLWLGLALFGLLEPVNLEPMHNPQRLVVPCGVYQGDWNQAHEAGKATLMMLPTFHLKDRETQSHFAGQVVVVPDGKGGTEEVDVGKELKIRAILQEGSRVTFRFQFEHSDFVHGPFRQIAIRSNKVRGSVTAPLGQPVTVLLPGTTGERVWLRMTANKAER